jgi:hypothetical protein
MQALRVPNVRHQATSLLEISIQVDKEHETGQTYYQDEQHVGID